jgi:hypothetical protein
MFTSRPVATSFIVSARRKAPTSVIAMLSGVVLGVCAGSRPPFLLQVFFLAALILTFVVDF